jgi:hypothetical protein
MSIHAADAITSEHNFRNPPEKTAVGLKKILPLGFIDVWTLPSQQPVKIIIGSRVFFIVVTR